MAARGSPLARLRFQLGIEMTTLEQMAEWIASRGDDSLPPTARERLAIHLLDTVGAWLAGRETEDGKKLARLESAPSQPVPVLRPQPLDRIALGVATTRLTEIDDIHMPSCMTPSSVVVPTALLMAEHLQQRDARAFAQALSAGYEVMTRFGLAVSGPALLSRGIWPTYLAAPICAAAVASRLLGLTAEKTADALGIALTMTTGDPGRPAGMTPRWLLLGLAARAGSTAALAASEGYAGDRTLLDGDWWMRAQGIHCEPRALLGAAQGNTAVQQLSLKPYCAAKQTVAAIDAFRDLLREGISPADIVAVRVAVPPAYAEMVGHRNAASRVGRITSAAYHLALAAYQPEELDNVARPNLAGDPQIAAFMERIEVVPDSSLEQYYPQRWPARVEVALKNGRTDAKLVLDARGDPPRSSDVGVRAKFHRLADPVVGKPASGELEATCLAATSDGGALATLCAKMSV